MPGLAGPGTNGWEEDHVIAGSRPLRRPKP
jgi:hypothetical protein